MLPLSWTYMSDTFTAATTSNETTFALENVPGWFTLGGVEIHAAPEPRAVFLCGLGLGPFVWPRRGAGGGTSAL